MVFDPDLAGKQVLAQGFYLGGTSEGAMTVCRFDDQRYGDLIMGRFINSFSMEPRSGFIRRFQPEFKPAERLRAHEIHAKAR